VYSPSTPPPPKSFPLSLHDALPISRSWLPADEALPPASAGRIRPSSRPLHDCSAGIHPREAGGDPSATGIPPVRVRPRPGRSWRSEEHTSELQSRVDLVCRLLLEKQ